MSNSVEKKKSAKVGFGDSDASLEAEDSETIDGGETELESSSVRTYPEDCYTFMAINGPFDKNGFFWFGFIVWAIQTTFMTLLVLRVAHPTLSTNENDDNPDMDQGSGFAFANFVPSNSNLLTKTTQYMALFSYCFFADASVRDIVTAVETFPQFSKVRPGDRVGLIVFSCLLRFVQGVMHSIVTFLLIINTSDVIDIILNFTAANFIADFDNVAFGLCQWGKYGPALKQEADRIETLPAPVCIHHEHEHIRYRYTIITVFFGMLVSLVLVSMTQHSLEYWLTTRLRIQFKDDPLREGFNGCYDFETRQNRRVLFKSFEANAEAARIGYCQENKKWYLMTGNQTSACDAIQEEVLAFSSKTYAFDVSTIFEETWYSPTGTPLELYFFDDEKNNLSDDECSSFIGDGICDEAFNIIDHNFDNGDCCGTTCNSLNCGIENSITGIFNDPNSTGSGYNTCVDPQMKPITIHIDNYYFVTETSNQNVSIEIKNPFAGLEPIEPPLRVDCEGKNMLTVNVKQSMMLQTETIWIPDGANCQINVKNTTTGSRRVPFVNYTVYHGDPDSIDTNPIVIMQGDSSVEGMYSFQRIPECYFTKLYDHVNISTIYTGNEPSNKAVRWLMEDTLGFSYCEYDTFLERYALATINYAAPKVKEDSNSDETATDLWITPERQCEWPFVACVEGRIIELDLAFMSISGTIATEIGLLKELTWLNFRSNKLYGTIPSEIEDLQNLYLFGVEQNALTGTIPTVVGNMPNLNFFSVYINQMTGPLPSEIGKMSSLTGLGFGYNKFNGTIPNEIAGLPFLQMIFGEYNLLTGTIPTQLATLPNLQTVKLENNTLTGTIPTELGQLTGLSFVRIDNNTLTGSIPTSLLEKSFDLFEYIGNNLSGLIPLDGEVVCSAGGGEVYCNCASDCTFASRRCGCEEAQSCCSEYIGNATKCIVCPFGLENPFNILNDYAATCLDMGTYLENDILQFGDEETCDNVAKPFFHDIGCRCKNGISF